MKKPDVTKQNDKTAPEAPKAPVDASQPVPAADPLQTKIDELVGDLQRTRADFENFRKNVEKDKDNVKKLARLSTIEKFLPLLDDLDRAIATYPELKPLEKSFEKSLKALGLEKMPTIKGADFNPEYHDAVMSEGEGAKEVISETLRPGYFYEGEVLRPAMVKIELQ